MRIVESEKTRDKGPRNLKSIIYVFNYTKISFHKMLFHFIISKYIKSL